MPPAKTTLPPGAPILLDTRQVAEERAREEPGHATTDELGVAP